MRKVGRVVLAVLAGMIAWAALWNLGTRGAQAAWPEDLGPDQPVTHLGILLGYIVYSVLLSVLAGYVTARVALERAMLAVWWLAGIQLTLGIIAEVSYWSLLPVWYHLVFLALVVPATVYGGRLVMARAATPVNANA